jgi:RNA polymerase sigma-70 factor (ECF subfamily)
LANGGKSAIFEKTPELFTFDRLRGFIKCMAHEKLHLPLPFDQIIQRHEREIMRYLLRVSGNRDDAADLSQETWLRAYRAYPRLQPESEVRPWLYAIAINLCRNRARDGARRARVIVGSNEGDTVGRHHRSFDESEGYAAVRMREMIADLPTRQREALHLRYFAGLDYAEIAGAMGCSEESARANVSQAMKKLRVMW